jgi:hypothetical protein
MKIYCCKLNDTEMKKQNQNKTNTQITLFNNGTTVMMKKVCQYFVLNSQDLSPLWPETLHIHIEIEELWLLQEFQVK